MSTSHFRIHKHTLPASHIREYPRATADDQEDVLQLAVKQYTPLKPTERNESGVTIIGAHANGFPKELYEPLWDDLYERLQAKKIHVRSIWIADVSQQGESGVLNEARMGNDPSWMDHPRDLFLMINYFRKYMKRPLIGIGHSMGGCHLVNLSLMHPRLFTTLILIDPVIQRLPSVKGNFGPARASTVRRDRWLSKQAAEAAFKRSKFYQTWDPRVLEKWVEHGLRELPTQLYPEFSAPKTLPTVSADPITASILPDKFTEREMTLKTTKHQEVFTFMRPIFNAQDHPSASTCPDPDTHLDLDVTGGIPSAPFYRPEPRATFMKLPFVRPSVFYVFGENSDLSAPVHKADKMAHTGTGVGGSGGVKQGRVAEVTFEGVGHLIPMEIVGQTADAITGWLAPELERWGRLEEAEREEWSQVPRDLKAQMSDKYQKRALSDWATQFKQSKL